MNKVNNEALYTKNKTVIVDVRTPDEYNAYHIEDALSIPIFTNEERVEIGTTYKQVSRAAAKQLGMKFMGCRLEEISKVFLELSDKYDQVIVYCQRGGMRSASVVSLFNALGQGNIYQLVDGIKGHRQFISENVEKYLEKNQFVLLHGHTGVGKTKLLVELENSNFPVIDLEGIAQNAGSVFGTLMYNKKPPSQKQFEEKLFSIIVHNESDYLFIESESKRVGTVNIPEIYMEKMEQGIHVLIETSLENRIKNLLSDYIHANNDQLIASVGKLKKRIGQVQLDQLIDYINHDNLEPLVEYLLTDYYDPLYTFSIDKYEYQHKIHYDHISEATNILMNTFKKGN